MADFRTSLDPALRDFIAAQHMFFVATAPRDGGRVNLSPKGLDSFRVLDDRRVAYLDLTGSGIETAAHVEENGRLTIMFCSYDEKPLILRLYGTGRVVRPRHDAWSELAPLFPAIPGARQVIVLEIDSVQTSCGFGVPRYAFAGQRDTLPAWSEKVGPEKLREKQAEWNTTSIDGLPSRLLADA